MERRDASSCLGAGNRPGRWEGPCLDSGEPSRLRRGGWWAALQAPPAPPVRLGDVEQGALASPWVIPEQPRCTTPPSECSEAPRRGGR
eukprot:14961693-Alexandrium_andersonii.AAC.1